MAMSEKYEKFLEYMNKYLRKCDDGGNFFNNKSINLLINALRSELKQKIKDKGNDKNMEMIKNSELENDIEKTEKKIRVLQDSLDYESELLPKLEECLRKYRELPNDEMRYGYGKHLLPTNKQSEEAYKEILQTNQWIDTNKNVLLDKYTRDINKDINRFYKMANENGLSYEDIKKIEKMIDKIRKEIGKAEDNLSSAKKSLDKLNDQLADSRTDYLERLKQYRKEQKSQKAEETSFMKFAEETINALSNYKNTLKNKKTLRYKDFYTCCNKLGEDLKIIIAEYREKTKKYKIIGKTVDRAKIANKFSGLETYINNSLIYIKKSKVIF